MSVDLRRGWIAAGLWLAVFAVTLVLLLGRTVNVRDEAWMLWLATRLARGDVIYRDAYDVTTPVAAWLAAAVVSVTGTQMWALRALAAAIFATEVVVGVSVVRRCGTRGGSQTVLVLALLAVAAPFAAFVSLYSALAILGGLCTLRATLWWLDGLARPDGAGGTAAPRSGTWAPWAAWVVGAAVGLTFWTKPNVGVLVALAVAVAVVAAASGDDRAGVAAGAVRMLGGATVVSVLVAGVLVATGAWSAFVDQVFLSKGEYFDVGFGYLPALADRLDVIVVGRRPFEVRRVLAVAVQAAPLVLLPVLAVGVVRARRSPRGPLAALAAFAVAGLLAVLPRPGLNHITGVMPLVLPAVVGTWTLALGTRPASASSTTRRVHPALVGAGALAAVGIVAVAAPLVSPRTPSRFERGVEQFVGAPVRRAQLEAARGLRDGLQERGIETVFIAREDAGFLYLRTGTSNPLPYDMVERSDLGGADERGVIRRIAGGEVEWVCLHPPRAPGRADGDLIPRTLERWARANLEPVAELPRCDLYRAPATG